jgi:hypothetical protein
MRRIALITLFLSASTAFAGPVAAPGDIGLRHEIQMLADYGAITGPTTAWPIAWDAVLTDLEAAHASEMILPVAVRATFVRVLERARRETRRNDARMNARVSASEKPTRIRGFTNAPYEEGELSAGFSWAGEHVSLDINATGAYEPLDGKEARVDGSRLAVDWGNVTIAASTMDRWWGPGWDGSLILSNNARPIPALTISRNRTHAFKTKWLSWLGPWDLDWIFGQMEEERVVPNARFFGMRFSFRPVPSLEIGLSRSAQWCGDDRPCGFDTFMDLFFGKDNVGDAGTTPENEPGNQLGGFDIRWSNMWFGQPSAFYAQAIGEDEAGGFPSRYMGMVGIETSGYIRNRWSYRWYAEWAGTSCDVIKSEVRYNCAYNHGIYETGYRYHGRVVGHGTENDSRVVSMGFVLVSLENTQWHLLIRDGTLNKDGGLDIRNTLTPSPLELSSIDLTHSRQLGKIGWLDIGIGYERLEDGLTGEESNDARGFITWRSR